MSQSTADRGQFRPRRPRQRVKILTAQLATRDLLYKTVDSTLRGHVSELEPWFEASGRKILVFAPAFPTAGRTTVGGVQLVDGIPFGDHLWSRSGSSGAALAAYRLVPSSIGSVVILDAATQEELDAQIEALPEPEVRFVGGLSGHGGGAGKSACALLGGCLTADRRGRLATFWLRSERKMTQSPSGRQDAQEPGVTLLRSTLLCADG